MKKKIVSFLVAALMLTGSISALAAETNKAVLLCYDSGKLIYSTLLTVGEYKEIPQEYESADKKVYVVDEDKFMTIEEYDAISSATATPEATAAPTAAPEETPEPAKTPEATTAPAKTTENTPYEKAADAIYAPALITSIAQSKDSKDEEVYSLTVMYQGNEVSVNVPEDLAIKTAPDEYASLIGKNAGSLKKGDVVIMTANIAGTKIKTLDLLFRPTKDDIATGETNYGASFEKLFSSGGLVAGKWKAARYGEKISGDEYAFGVVAKSSGNVLTLLNKSGITDNALEIDMAKNVYVYSCDVSGKEYGFDIGGKGNIEVSLPSSILNDDTYEFDGNTSYNYALVRIVDGTATEIIEYTNYND